jgi:subtilisin family serine protease
MEVAMSRYTNSSLTRWSVPLAALIAIAMLLLVGSIDRVGAAAPSRVTVIVTLDAPAAEVPLRAARLARAHGGDLGFVYQHALTGFSVTLPAAAVGALSRAPSVLSVEPDGSVWLVETQASPPSWGLDRIDQRALPLDQSYAYPNTATQVRAYIIDTGIENAHADFGGRAVNGYDFIDSDAVAQDCHGHGTHVAGTVGGAAHGVAKGVTLVGVRVLNCSGSGTWSGVIAGVDWVKANHPAGTPGVANMSLGGGANSSVDRAVQNAVAAGITFVVAAGNSNANACNSSPARTPEAITVGATTNADVEASFSNYGQCVDLLAPGVNITSAWLKGATRTISGTSMAAPHVAGAAALHLGTSPTSTPSAVSAALTSAATSGAVTLKAASSSAGTPNLLLYVGAAAPPPQPVTGTIAGRVTDAQTGQGIAGASVSLDTNVSTTTDATGHYSLTQVTPGTRTVTATASGYQSGTMEVSVTAGEIAVADLALARTDTGTNVTSVASIACSGSGGRDGKKDLVVTVTLRDSLEAPVSGASVSTRIVTGSSTWTRTGTTGSTGQVAFKISSAPLGSYAVTVTSVTATPTWDGEVVTASCVRS